MANRIEEEKRVVELMIRLYCSKKEGNKNLCPACSELLDYALQRLSHCKFGSRKSTCRRCTVHCYRPERREQMRAVMCWVGPRMILYHPFDAIRHLVRDFRLYCAMKQN